MGYGLTIDTVPVLEPVSVAGAKTHLRVDTDSEDDYIKALIVSARLGMEDYTQRAFITQTLDLTLDCFPRNDSFVPNYSNANGYRYDPTIRLPRSPVQSITSITYTDTAGASQTLSASLYTLDTKSLVPRIVPAYGEVWPSTRTEINAVTIKFVAGYGTAASSVPAPIVHAIKLLVGTHYDPVRATVVIGNIARKLPDAADALLGPYRVATRAGS